MRHKKGLVLSVLGGLVLLLALGACSSSESIGDRLVSTQGIFDELPLTAGEAIDAGWIATDECVPEMGRHFLKMAGEQPGPMILMFNPDGELIGVELESLSEQPSPPWEHLQEGHPGMEFEHWTIHMYFDDPAEACEN